ncbi:LysR family transcriptional regulator [Pseudomonas lundensis]|uniref:LysR family transcriptional regulator n=2 Tax=Pseudomonas lundensis TaxID=86185 RepID=A0ABX4GFQ4_9PSED|nr:LysR family transcriptional regulator [Pseudomonas lundensis]KMM93761.1 LysR family transcriptional regulator [Pseudomonas lundensis]MBM1189218.1 LysR family transcriptional regulator [Pseudomonas lundensis]MCT8952104.1 LysR family transcriptional regulator [Pseudomonas lundensis]NMZ57006.1 LysR family transcriptional regulator [Pseudomonas lundensis]NNA00353.1 LysR family transcriptional regulator [Pseudomonas lundensis]
MVMVLLRNIDLNLLVVLDALLTEKHVTRTGARLHLSQPAISHSLSKLRVLLDDPILIRQGSEVVLSALAQNLQAPLKEILSQIEILLGKSIDFVPANSHRTFRLAMSDYGAAIVLPKLLRQLRAEAPNTTLVVTQDSRHGMLEQIAQGKIDLALGVFPNLSADISSEVLFEETFSCLLDRSTLPANGQLDLDNYLLRPHISVSVDGCSNGEIDRLLRDEGLQRRIAVSVPHWRTAPSMISNTDLILTVATRTLDNALLDEELVSLSPPLPIPPFPFVQLWHNRFGEDPAHRWLREQVRQVVGHAAPAT